MFLEKNNFIAIAQFTKCQLSMPSTLIDTQMRDKIKNQGEHFGTNVLVNAIGNEELKS